MQYAEFILDCILLAEVQVNNHYAVILEAREDDPEMASDATFRPLTRIPSDEEMTREYNRGQEAGIVVMFLTVLYRDANTFQFRSLRSDNIIAFTIDQDNQVITLQTPDDRGH